MGEVVLLFLCHRMQEEVPGCEPGISAVSLQSRESPVSPSDSVRPGTLTALQTLPLLSWPENSVFQGVW